MTKTAILIPVFNNLSYTKKCLAHLKDILIRSKLELQFPIVVIDDGSKDGTSDWIRNTYPEVILLQGNGNLWWSGCINLGARHSVEQLHCTHVLLWNNDIQIQDDYFIIALQTLSRYKEDSIIGSKIYADLEGKTVWSMGGRFNPRTGAFGMIGYMEKEDGSYSQVVDADWITGMGTFVPAGIIKDIGYWDASAFPQYHGDTEFTYRAKMNGYKNLIHPELTIWNDITSTGLSHKGNLLTLLRLLSDRRSLYNWMVNSNFLRKYATGIRPWISLGYEYFKLFGGYFKWKVLNIFRFRNQCP